MPQTIIHKLTMYAGPQQLSMPVDAKIIHAADQYDQITIWYETENPSVYENRNFEVVGTGMYFNKNRRYSYVGTVLQDQGHLVWHIYEIL